MVMPENGMIALNPPLSPARRGSCSTRTSHPYFIALYNKFLRSIKIGVEVENPYQLKTKGELVAESENLPLLQLIARDSVSCGKKGRYKINSIRKTDVNGCGCCVPCLYRRASLHTIGVDSENYGWDVCAGEISINPEGATPYDFRDMISFLATEHDIVSLRQEILASAPLEISDLSGYAELVLRGRAEVYKWLKDKSTVPLSKWGL